MRSTLCVALCGLALSLTGCGGCAGGSATMPAKELEEAQKKDQQQADNDERQRANENRKK